jgi:uncharacterized protein YbdZ (MbtH family)
MIPTNNPVEGRASDNHETTTPTQDPRLQELPPDLATDSPPALDPDLLDPFHPENLRLDQSYLEQPAGRKLLTTVPIRKPHSQDFFRVHPSEEYRVSLAAMITLKDDNDTFLVHPSFVSELAHGEFYHATLYLVINRQKVISIWPVKQAGPEQRPMAWHVSAADAAQKAMKSWIRIIANRSLGAYEILQASGPLSEPEWPDLAFSEILAIAFRDRIVRDHHHPVIKRLRGTE